MKTSIIYVGLFWGESLREFVVRPSGTDESRVAMETLDVEYERVRK